MSSKTNRNEKANARRAAIEQIRKEQQAKERRRALLGAGAVGLVLIALVGLIIIGTRPKHAGLAKAGPQILPTAVTSADGATTVENPIRKVANTTGIPGVIAYDTTGWPVKSKLPNGVDIQHNHVPGPIQYSVVPPVGGDHNGTWMNAGVYTAAIPSERAVHDLEHGVVWVTYRPNLPRSEVEAVEKFAGGQSLIDEGTNANRFMLVSPWADNSLPAPIVLSSWGYQLYITNPSDPRMQEFVNKFRRSGTYTPENQAAVDSIPINAGPQSGQLGGGQPAMYGSKYANQKNY